MPLCRQDDGTIVVVVKAETAGEAEEDADEEAAAEAICAICLQNVEVDAGATGGCPVHAGQFHQECITQWSGPCPICRYQNKISPRIATEDAPQGVHNDGAAAALCLVHGACITAVLIGLPICMVDLPTLGTGRCTLLSIALAALAAQLLGYVALMAHFIDSDLLCRRRHRGDQSPSCMLSLYKALVGFGILLHAVLQVVVLGPCGGSTSVLAAVISVVVAAQLAFVSVTGDRHVGDSLF